MKQRLAILFVLGLSLAAGLYAVLRTTDSQPTEEDTVHLDDAGGSYEGADGGRSEPDGAPVGWEEPVFDGRSLRALVDGASVGAQFEVGIAGIFPSLQGEGPKITIPQLEPGVEWFEVRVVTADAGHGFWGLVPAETDVVELRPASGLAVIATTSTGEAVEGARARIAREPVALITAADVTDGAGRADFAGLPAGAYHVTVEARGFLTATREIDVGDEEGEVRIVLDAGAEVSGSVASPDGKPVAGARVLVHVERGGLTAAALVVPEAVAETDARGKWELDALPPGRTSVTAFAAGWAPVRSAAIDTSFTLEPPRFDLRLVAGRTVNVRVVDPGGRPVLGAHVTWVDEMTGLGATALVDDAAAASFGGLPPTASLSASFAEWSSPDVALEAVPDPRNIELVLQRFDASKLWRVRVEPPSGVELWEVSATDARGARCIVETIGTSDFALRDCGPGELTLAVTTSAGTVEVRTDALDGVEVALPAPAAVQLTVVGAANEDWANTVFVISGGPSVLELGAQTNGAEAVLRADLYPGLWQLTVTNARTGARNFPVRVTGPTYAESFRLRADARLRLWVVDRYDAPINGAQVLLFEDGRLVDVARSGGQLPAEFSVAPPWRGTALAVDARRGEGSVVLQVDGEGKLEQRIQLSDAVMTRRVPPTRLSVGEVQARMGAQLVQDGEGYLLDFDRADAPGAVAGLQRRDRLVTAWPEGGALRVFVHRGGAGYLDVTVP